MHHRDLKAAGRWCARAGLSSILGLCLIGPVRAETENKTAQPGQRVFLQSFSYYVVAQGCRSQAASVELVRPPRGGRIEQRREFRTLTSVIEDNGRSRSSSDGCETVKKNTTSLYYTARPDFSGRDRLDVDVTFSDGTTVPYIFWITVPEGKRREAPAVSQAPVRRDGGSGQAAGASRVAPAGQAATAEGFLRETARGATPVNRPAPAVAEPPKAADRTEPPASAANDTPPPAARIEAPPSPPAPREMAPVRSPRPPATPQL